MDRWTSGFPKVRSMYPTVTHSFVETMKKKKLFQKFQKSSEADRRESQLKTQMARQTENVFLQKKKIIRKAEIV